MTMELKALDLQGRYFPPGEVIADRFKLGERLGEGPFGQVYRAEDTLIEADVALKVFASEVIAVPPDEERFVKATRRARALTQKNVVRLHDSGVHKNHPWVSMQHLEGLNLRKVVGLRREKEESFGLDELEPIISQITLALQHVGRDFPHGDLKPENIIFLPDLLKITDSYVLSALPESVFAERNGASPFIAPELQSPGGQIDPRCDVYSVGAIIGYVLFGDDYEPGSRLHQGGALAAVDTLCRRAMAFDPVERYASVEALNEDFTSIVDTGGLLQERSAPVRPPVPPPAEPTMPTMPSVPEPELQSGLSAPSSPMSVEMVPPPAPPPEAEEPVNPLDIQTSPDIGKPLEEDVTTREYNRDSKSKELGDLLPTNEVDRSEFPEPSPREKRSMSAPPPAKPKKPTTPKDIAKADEPAQKAKKSTEEKKSGSTLAPVLGAFAMSALMGLAAIFVFGMMAGKDGADRQAEAVAPGVAEVEESEIGDEGEVVDGEAEALAAAEAEAAAEEEARLEEERRQLWSQAFAEVLTHRDSALDAAVAQARERAEELEEEERQAASAQAAAGGGVAGGGGQGAAGRPSGGSAGAAAAPATNCPSTMVLVQAGGNNVCVDAYEFPGRGRTPEVNVSWFEARRLCQQQNQRLCSINEWRAACGARYPYGRNFNADRCNTADEDGFERSLAPTGSFPGCRSPSGAYDMSGNVHEWVEEQRVAGGGYDSDADLASCRYSSPKAPGSSDPNVGFRCCADPT